MSLDMLCRFVFHIYFCFRVQLNNKESPMGMAVGMPDMKGSPAAVDLAKNPLAETHEFKQACSICYVKTGEESYSCVTASVVFRIAKYF